MIAQSVMHQGRVVQWQAAQDRMKAVVEPIKEDENETGQRKGQQAGSRVPARVHQGMGSVGNMGGSAAAVSLSTAPGAAAPTFTLDVQRVLAMAGMASLVFAPIMHRWYPFLHRICGGGRMKMLAADQLVRRHTHEMPFAM